MNFKTILIKTLVVIFILLAIVATIQAGDKETIFSMRDWMAKDEDFKQQIIRSYIKAAKEDHVIIRLPAEYYKKEMESLVQNSIKNGEEAGIDNSFGATLKIIAIMEGDWDNGRNKLEYAKEFMGPVVFEDFIKRYPTKYKKLQQEAEGNK
jgi:hypothetical protein